MKKTKTTKRGRLKTVAREKRTGDFRQVRHVEWLRNSRDDIPLVYYKIQELWWVEDEVNGTFNALWENILDEGFTRVREEWRDLPEINSEDIK